jgi:nucleoside-diphosphate-sugar epimerase
MSPGSHARILVAGGAGFIGSALVRHLALRTDATVVNVDALMSRYAPRSASHSGCGRSVAFTGR